MPQVSGDDGSGIDPFSREYGGWLLKLIRSPAILARTNGRARIGKTKMTKITPRKVESSSSFGGGPWSQLYHTTGAPIMLRLSSDMGQSRQGQAILAE
jgi:hypothetical protein